MAYATITLEMFASGLHVSCDDIGLDEFVPAGDTDILRTIAESPDASIRFDGKYQHEHKLTRREKSAMLQVLDGYEALKYLIQSEEDIENL